MYGRYEYKDDRSDKFWTIEKGETNGEVKASWGRNGHPPQGSTVYSMDEARKKLHEKTSKGYRLVSAFDGHYKTEQEAAIERLTAKKAAKLDAGNFMDLLKKI